MRLVGPNCMGVVNTHPDVSLTATFSRADVPAGTVGFVSQSGAFGAAAIDGVSRRGIGLSAFVSLGDKADLSSNDLLQYWEQDPATQVVALYLESFGNPRKFGRVARRLARAKPVLAVKAGRTSAGARAASSHTGALIAASDSTVDALFASAGVIRCDGLDELLDAAAVLAEQPLPAGSDVAIVANGRGPLVVCADACADAGLDVVTPVQLPAGPSPEEFAGAVETAAGEADAVIAIYVEHIAIGADDVAAALAGASLETPLLAVVMTPGELPSAGRVPVFRAPERAAKALGRAAAYARWRATPPHEPPRLEGIDSDAAAATLSGALARGGGWLRPDEVQALLGAYGVALVEQRRVGSTAAAGKAAAELGGEVALKGIAPGVVHKAQAGAVRLGLSGPTAVRRAADDVAQRLAGAGTPVEGFLVQRMARAGVEMLVGVLADERFGPVVACGAGGGSAEVLGDVAVRLAPLAREEALGMIGSLRSLALLEREGSDIGALAEIVVRVGALADAHPEIAELDLNPVMVGPDGAPVVDARVRVAPPAIQPVFPAVGR
jgi:acyl-CoA synthetase (NDP forming)